jgi:pimeloyl-ACP methyl ester carboxylesterase
MPNYFHDTNHVRYELVATHEGKPYNWLFLPGGPGGDSRYLLSLVNLLELPGNVWLVDLPGNGDNLEAISTDYDFDLWFDIFLPTIKKFKNPIVVGHSFGGMFPLCFPELEEQLKGFVILNSAPSLWFESQSQSVKKYHLPDVTKEEQEFSQNPSALTYRTLLDASLPYYFSAESLDRGKVLFNVPCHFRPSIWWQRKASEINFSAKWIPQHVPTLIIGGTEDCICPYSLFEQDARFKRANIEMINIDEGWHLPWIENPEMVKTAFKKFCLQLKSH